MNRQKIHYENIHDDYSKYYYDKWSMKYRRKFFYDVMFKGIDLNDKDVAELASGSGYNSAALLKKFPSMRITGFDISNKACNDYRNIVGRPCYNLDLTQDTLPFQAYDVVFVLGGLHHCIENIEGTIMNIAQTIKPNGFFIMVEPNRDYLFQLVRDIWYRKDSLFDANSEKALSHGELLTQSKKWFCKYDVTYGGGPGYFLILNSLVCRLPNIIKYLLHCPLIACEHLYNTIPGHIWFPYFIARWSRLSI